MRDESGGRRIYHSILADYILGQMSEEEKKKYHKRAIKIYRGKLKKAKKEQTKPDELAAVRLPEHVLSVEGDKSFIYVFTDECIQPLTNLGLLDEAISLSERALRIVKDGSVEEAMVLGNLGFICQTKGQLDRAEEIQKRSLEIDKKLDHIKAMAADYGNLGMIYQKRGEFDKAEEMVEKALKIDEKLGLLEWGATAYGNLGVIYQGKGKLDKAEEMHKKSLEIAERIGLITEISRQYGNLGLIYLKRGELDKAEKTLKRSLVINEKLGLLEGMAKVYGSLGLVYKQQGDLEKARGYWEKSLDLFKKIGMPNEIKEVEWWIEEIKEK